MLNEFGEFARGSKCMGSGFAGGAGKMGVDPASQTGQVDKREVSWERPTPKECESKTGG